MDVVWVLTYGNKEREVRRQSSVKGCEPWATLVASRGCCEARLVQQQGEHEERYRGRLGRGPHLDRERGEVQAK